MSIISRYILRNHLAPFLFGTMTVVFLFLFQFLLKYLDQLVGKGLEEWVIVQLIVLNMAWMLVLAVPMGLLFSTLMTFGNMSASLEVTVIKASGGGLLKMMLPMIISGAVMTVFIFWFNDEILPEANHQAKIMMNDIQRKKPTFAVEAGQFSTQLEGYTILSRKIDSLSRTLKSVTVYDQSKKNQVNIANADSGHIKLNRDYTKLIVTLYSGEIHQFSPFDLNNYRKALFEEYQILIDAKGFAFERSAAGMVSRGDRELHIRDMEEKIADAKRSIQNSNKRLNEQILKQNDYLLKFDNSLDSNRVAESPRKEISLRAALQAVDKRISFFRSAIGTDMFQKSDYELVIKQYFVEIYKKYSIPFACLVFVLIGCPLGIITRGGNFGFSAGISLLFYLFYWACLIGGEKLADRGIMPPFLSMWLGNIIVGIIGIILMLRINNESTRIFKMWRLPLFKRKNKRI